MISEIFSAEPFFWTCLWQSTIFITAGLIGSFILRHRSARAHQVLLLAVIAAVIVPVFSKLFKHYKLGLLTAEPTVIQSETEDRTITSNIEKTGIIPLENIDNIPNAAENDLASTVTTLENTKFSQYIVVLYGWLGASLILAFRLAMTFMFGVRLINRTKPLECEGIEQAIHLAKAKLQINKDIMVYSSDLVRSPVIWCWSSRPTLLLPIAAGQPDNTINWSGVICHELAHWKRRDHISGLSAELVVCIMPWHPLLWWAKSRLIRLSEQACDEWVVATGQPRTDYADSLLDLAACGQMAFLPAVVSSKKGLAGRIRHILKDNCPNPHTGAVWALTVTIMAVCLTFGVALAQTRPNRTEGRAVMESQSDEARVIHFPKDRLMGMVYIRDVEPDNWYENWQKLNEATGDIAIARNKEVKLEINEEAAKDLSPLNNLRADDIQMLSFGWKPVKITSLAPIGNLRGLKALNLQTAKFNSEDFKHLTELSQLEVLRLGDHQLTDGSMKYIGKLTSLCSLALWGTGISDEGLKHLQGLKNLTFLALNNCKITDEGLNYLKNMTALEGLQLTQTKITDKGLAKLKNFTRLKSLLIGYTNITDEGLEHLQTLTSLEIIWINSTPITDQGIAYLGNMKNLKELYASRTKITDAGLAHLKDLRMFRHLTISGIGDGGIQHLSKLPALEMIQILDAQVTKASIPYFKKMGSIKEVLLSGDKVDDDLLNALRTALPNCKIWDPQRSRDYPMAEWRQRFEAVYRLEKGQILKRISPPFIPERRDYYLNEYSHQASLVSRSPDRFVFHWDRKLKRWGYGFINTPDIDSTLRSVLGLNTFEYDGPEELLSLKLPGDWIVRDGTSQEMKLKAFEQLLAEKLGRHIRFEKRTVEQEVVIATGHFKFHPISEAIRQDVVHLYVDELRTSGGGTAHSVAELLQTIGNRANIYVVDRTEPSEENNILYYIHSSSRDLRRMKSSPEKTEKLKMFLANLTDQTELQFEVAIQPVEIWFATENKEKKIKNL
jgi:beta-lactamase regulating signal transducer with metallopeptidase domain/Leucine-rich repeat (LRR) protein